MELADWQLQTEKVALLTNSHENKLTTAILTSTPYKMVKRMGRDKKWQDIKKKMEGVLTNCY